MAIDLSTRKSDGGAMQTTTDTRPAAETLGRCLNCKRTFDPYVRTTEGYVVHQDGSIRTPGTPARTVALVGDLTDTCPTCGSIGEYGWTTVINGRWWEFATLKARYSRTACDDLCTTATGSTCRCSCGGWAHGSRA